MRENYSKQLVFGIIIVIANCLPATVCHYLHFLASTAMDERLSAYALIARAAINVTVPFLIRLFSERLSKLNQVHISKH